MSLPKLPLLAPHETALEKCVYCPKLSRAACPVSNVEANETVTPWGKMSMAYFAARGDVPIDEEHAESAWACSACYGCRERCEHRNPVADVLSDARAELFAAGVAPAAAQRVASSQAPREAENRDGVERLDSAALKSARVGVLIGCSYVRHHPTVASEIWKVATTLVSGELRAIRACCGLPLLHAGDRRGLDHATDQLRAELEGLDRLITAGPGCARRVATLSHLGVECEPLIDVVYAKLDDVPALALEGVAYRYHDPCQLGRGLGRFDEPRAVLARLTGKVPAELPRSREQSECSGGGGLLPVTRSETSAAIATERIEEHRTAGGGTLVTACGQSLRRFAASGEQAVDLMSLVAQALSGHGGR
jgi:Fe-S oxidoreductase